MDQSWERQLREQGKRITSVCRAVVGVLKSSYEALCLAQVKMRLEKRGVRADETTVFRQLESLTSAGVLEKTDIQGKRTYYEFSSRHHHHFVCNTCRKSQCLEENAVSDAVRAMERILNRSGARVDSHVFSLSGKCRECAQRNNT